MVNEIYDDCVSRMNKSVQALEGIFTKVRAGRANPSLLEQITVDYYGSMVPITQVANVSAEDARTLKVSPWEKDMVRPIEKAIMTSDLGLNPVTVGEIIRLPLPALTEERRKELVKVVKDNTESTRTAVRNVRRDGIKDIKELLKEKEISEDVAKSFEDKMQLATDNAIKKAEVLLAEKTVSLLEI
jgi:ribosome recycling factor